MKLAITLLLATAFFLSDAQAQKSDTIPCPTITLKGPADDKVADGEPAVFTATYYRWDMIELEADRAAVSFIWMVSNGTILNGQGTPTISVDTKGLKGKKITATLALVGLTKGCQNERSLTVTVGKPK